MKMTGLMWWIDRWRTSSAYAHMTLEEQGAYRNLLDEATVRGGVLPKDDRVLAKACGDQKRWGKVRPAVMAHFQEGDDGWTHATLDAVLKVQRTRGIRNRRYYERTIGERKGRLKAV